MTNLSAPRSHTPSSQGRKNNNARHGQSLLTSSHKPPALRLYNVYPKPRVLENRKNGSGHGRRPKNQAERVQARPVESAIDQCHYRTLGAIQFVLIDSSPHNPSATFWGIPNQNNKTDDSSTSGVVKQN